MDNRGKNILDDDRIGQLLLKLSLPAFMGMFVMTLYNVVDTIFVGHYVGPLGIAGLSIVFPIQMLTMGIGHMMGMGGASLISRLIGAGNTPRAEHALGNAITSAAVLSAPVIIAGLSNPDLWLRLMGASETILPYARDYMTIILFGLFFRTFAMSQNALWSPRYCGAFYSFSYSNADNGDWAYDGDGWRIADFQINRGR